jgi:hypothetical protein
MQYSGVHRPLEPAQDLLFLFPHSTTSIPRFPSTTLEDVEGSARMAGHDDMVVFFDVACRGAEDDFVFTGLGGVWYGGDRVDGSRVAERATRQPRDDLVDVLNATAFNEQVERGMGKGQGQGLTFLRQW